MTESKKLLPKLIKFHNSGKKFPIQFIRLLLSNISTNGDYVSYTLQDLYDDHLMLSLAPEFVHKYSNSEVIVHKDNQAAFEYKVVDTLIRIADDFRISERPLSGKSLAEIISDKSSTRNFLAFNGVIPFIGILTNDHISDPDKFCNVDDTYSSIELGTHYNHSRKSLLSIMKEFDVQLGTDGLLYCKYLNYGVEIVPMEDNGILIKYDNDKTYYKYGI